jgi:hypothetical protein
MNKPLSPLIEAKPAVHAGEFDIEIMVARIISTNPRRNDSIIRKFRLRMATAVATTSTVTALAIAGLTGLGNTLPVISLAAPAQSMSKIMGNNGPAGRPSMSATMICFACFYDVTHLVPGPGFPSALPSIPTYQLGETPLTAEILGQFNMSVADGQPVDGYPVSTYTNDSGTLTNSGLFLTYSATSQNPMTGVVEGQHAINLGSPSASSLKTGFLKLFSNIESQLQVSDLQITTNSTTSEGSPTGTFNTLDFYTINFQVSVDGTNTVNTYGGTAELDSNGNLTYLTIPFFSLQQSIAYPFQNPADALAAINSGFDQQRALYLTAQHSTTTMVPGPTSQSGSPAGATGVGTGTPATTTSEVPASTLPTTTTTLPPLVDYVIDQVTVKYQMVSDSTGTVWLVPFYQLADSGTNSSWLSPAVSSDYIKVPIGPYWYGPALYGGVARPNAVR